MQRRLEKQFVVDGAGFEPAASAMPTLRSYQADLPAHVDVDCTHTSEVENY